MYNVGTKSTIRAGHSGKWTDSIGLLAATTQFRDKDT